MTWLSATRAQLHQTIVELPPGSARAAVVARCARVERLLGRYRESAALVAREIEALPDGEERSAVELRLELAAATIGDGVPEPVVAAARRVGGEPVQAAALAMSAYGDLARGARIRRTYARIAKAAGLVDSLPDDHYPALEWLSWAELLINRPADAVRHAERGMRLGGAYVEASMSHCLGIAQGVRGQLSQAVETLDHAAVFAGDHPRALIARSHQCEVLIWMGEAESAERLASAAARRAGRTAAGILAAVRLLHGDAAGCADLLVGVGGGYSLHLFEPLRRSRHLVVLSEAMRALGRYGEAERAARGALACGHGLVDGRARLALAGALRSLPLAVSVAMRFEAEGNLAEAASARVLAGTLASDLALTQPSAPLDTQPSTPSSTPPSAPLDSRPSDRLAARPSGPLAARPSGPLGARSSDSSGTRPSDALRAPSGFVGAEPSGFAAAQTPGYTGAGASGFEGVGASDLAGVRVSGRAEASGPSGASGFVGASGLAEEARGHLLRARELAASCGARLFAEAAARALVRVPVELSGREREVADLVVAGCSNREIAARLFVSARTVESTLTGIYAKLGISSRAALTALLTCR
ncbi:LuxR C-terminal-related transcriptional regulator [Nonomuraea sp. NPDC050556]|uniref:LuxR C-terminal-related transcriptional regulator n=1 Tax=Nonomuraea sp. NPDC050556 TaxID=3364369 RepID=UPI0037A17331